MSSETQAMSYEAMRKELEAAGYHWHSADVFSEYATFIAVTGSDWSFQSYHKPYTNEELVELAWQHYQREKQYAAMEVLLTKLSKAQATSWDDDGIPAYDSDYQDLIDEAKRILGK